LLSNWVKLYRYDAVRSRVFSGRLSDNAKTKANLLPRALAVGTAFATFLASPTQEGRWIAVFAMLALTVFDQVGLYKLNSDYP
jgi:hypothetical protein